MARGHLWLKAKFQVSQECSCDESTVLVALDQILTGAPSIDDQSKTPQKYHTARPCRHVYHISRLLDARPRHVEHRHCRQRIKQH